MSRLFAHASIDFQKYNKFKRLEPFWYNFPKGFFYYVEIHLKNKKQINTNKQL